MARTEKETRQLAWSHRRIDPANIVCGVNVRPKSPEHVTNLANSMSSKLGQLQPCMADMRDGQIVLWAGQHRKMAADEINERRKGTNKRRFRLKVNVANRPLDPDEILELQLAENLHNKMHKDDEAEAIYSLSQTYDQVFKANGKKTSVADLARRIGRSEDQVGDALKFARLDPRVKILVGQNDLTYSLAVSLSKLPTDMQFPFAVRVIQHNLTQTVIETLLKTQLGEIQKPIGFFDPEYEAQLEKESMIISFKRAADKAAQDAAGYFVRNIHLINLLDARGKTDMTITIKNILATFIACAHIFEEMLGTEAPPLADNISSIALLRIDQIRGYSDY